MGRKRKPRNMKREPITISLPMDLVRDFDNTLGKRTRSRAIESILRKFMQRGQTTLKITSYLYKCKTCDFEKITEQPIRNTFCYDCSDFNLYLAQAIKEEEE